MPDLPEGEQTLRTAQVEDLAVTAEDGGDDSGVAHHFPRGVRCQQCSVGE